MDSRSEKKFGINIARNIRAIQWLKCELLEGITSLYKAMEKGVKERIEDSLSVLIIVTYLLAKRLGFNFSYLESEILLKVDELIGNGDHELFREDLVALKEHLRQRK